MGDSSTKPGLDPTFPIRLRAARLRAGLSLEDLAQKLGGIVTRQAIAKYEKGLISPSPEVLQHLLQVLELPPSPDIPEEIPEEPEELEAEVRAFVLPGAEKDRFQSQEIKFQEITVPAFTRNNNDLSQTPAERALRLKQSWADLTPEEGIELRPEPRLPRKQVLALKLTLSEKMKNYLWLEKLLRQEKLFQPPLAMRIRNEQEAESAAGELRRHWDLGTGSVVNLLTFLEERGLKTFKLDGPEKFESLSGFYRGQPFIAVEKSLPVDRIRFRTAAELAQVMFGLVNEPEIIRLYNRFAAAFLLPAKILEEYFLPAGRKIAFSELAELKLRYGISLQAIMRRALDLELVTERRFRSFREMMNEKGWLWKEPVEYPGEENPTRFRRLLHYAVSSEILDLNRAAGLAEITPEQLKKEMGEIF
ncbi:MAG: helix-turn-helix domain-containing protein [Candidatus Saccharicenans sp.]|nr:helix-turn-helix domain-containing protein [Candidatus Saccharicenans sp.]MDH7492634.1 helix-turn-helix domain-containing protein [Candidatus Saccharicenans sp.]